MAFLALDVFALCPVWNRPVRVNTSSFVLFFHAGSRRHYCCTVVKCAADSVFHTRYENTSLSLFYYNPHSFVSNPRMQQNKEKVGANCGTDVQPTTTVDLVSYSFLHKAAAPSVICCFCSINRSASAVDNNSKPDVSDPWS